MSKIIDKLADTTLKTLLVFLCIFILGIITLMSGFLGYEVWLIVLEILK